MKRIFWYNLVCLLLVAVNSSDAVANLTVTSETHHVWGWVDGAPWGAPSQRWDYDYTDNNPVSGSVYYEGYEDRWYAQSSTGLLEVYAASSQLVSGSGNFAWAHADALWTFQPDDWSLMRLEVAVGWDIPGVDGLWYNDPFLVDLYDITDDSSLYYYSGTASNWGLSGKDPVVGYFSVDPTHEYNLHLAITSGANNDGPWSGSIRVTPIPAPSAIFLCSFGLGLVSWLRRRKTF